MAAPLIGEPRRPKRVRVADPGLAEQLQGFSFLDVEVAPTPEFDRVVRSLGAFFGDGSYFSDPSLTPKDIESLFIGARLLWAAAPWTLVDDGARVQVEVPAMGIEEGCVSKLLASVLPRRRIRALSRRLGVVQRQRKLDIVALVYSLSPSSGRGSGHACPGGRPVPNQGAATSREWRA